MRARSGGGRDGSATASEVETTAQPVEPAGNGSSDQAGTGGRGSLRDRGRALPLARLATGVALLLIGVAILVGFTVDVSWTAILQVALLVIGVLLVVLARSGGSHGGLVAIAIVLGVLLLCSWRARAPFDGGIGRRTLRPAVVTGGHIDARYGVGQFTLDLRKTAGFAPGETTVVHATVGAGRLIVKLPPTVAVVGQGRVGAGIASVFGKHHLGVAHDQTTAFTNFPGVPTVQLDLGAGFGTIEVQR